ncbi:MAG: hypothetical protein JWQ90_917 [Hydrocarboniphaga sp.]|uniref:RDD family protein n=1 Tax=Hydrocarboniphaga sp. TaxID=2033016 RepID=UPI00260E9BF0|nr:RDD family protein [Hydrocarboniphaga sp.]MDB5968467.1 hypothetical protein [Hydrocarboniphaga sp.]
MSEQNTIEQGGEPAAADNRRPDRPITAIAGFWRRFAALAVDSVLLGVFGLLIGAVFYEQLAVLGFRGRIVGFVIALLYFGVLNSRLGGGRTLGKRLLRIRVVGAEGAGIGLARASLRYLVLAIAWFLNGVPVDSDAFSTDSVPQMALTVACAVSVFGLAVAITYLAIFNRRTRQSLHDLLVGSYVVTDADGAPPSIPLWRGHWLVVLLILLISMAIPFGVRRLSQTPAFAAMMQVQRAVAREPGVSEVSIQTGTAARILPKDDAPPQHSLSITARSTVRDDPERLAQRIANRALDSQPEVAALNLIGVHIYYGYDIGIARQITAYSLVQTPLQWRQRIDTDAPEPDSDVETAPPSEPAKQD